MGIKMARSSGQFHFTNKPNVTHQIIVLEVYYLSSMQRMSAQLIEMCSFLTEVFSCFTILHVFQIHRKVIQFYIHTHTHIYFFRLYIHTHMCLQIIVHFIPIPKKGKAKECSNYRIIALTSHASKVMLKILKARLQQCVNRELPDVQDSQGHQKSKRVPEKHLFLLY